jgi:hypothetical protein
MWSVFPAPDPLSVCERVINFLARKKILHKLVRIISFRVVDVKKAELGERVARCFIIHAT